MVSCDTLSGPGLLPAKTLTLGRTPSRSARFHEAIVDDDVGLANQRQPADRHESGISGPGPDEVDTASLAGHPPTWWRATSRPPPRAR